MPADAIATNLAVVDEHIRNEGRDPASVMALYTDDAVLEVPTRGLRLTDKTAILANYRRIFSAIADVEIQPLDRFATADRVVDECNIRFRLTGDGMVDAPVGSRIEMRLVHVFHMRDGKIAREHVFESWAPLA
jgi:ketosteroid isomerase-like protein